MTSSYQPLPSPSASHGQESKPTLSEEKLKIDIAESLIKRGVNLDNKQIADVVGLQPKQIDDIEKSLQARKTISTDDKPKTWDYVLAFNCGDPAEIRKPNRNELRARSESKEAEDPSATQEWETGIPQNKYFGQIFHDVWKRLEKALLTVKAYRSEDKKRMFLIVGITEDNLKKWADDRDTDLLLDPTNACQIARSRAFPLALQTKLSPDEPDDKFPLPLSNWASMYAQYNHRANSAIYQHYSRIYGQDEPQTIFDEKTRLRIIYESIISDQAEGGAEIEISTLILDPRHPLKGVFPLHNENVLQEFRRDWVNRWNIKSLFWVPLDRVRNYFGEPVAFYFGFLSFYLQWLIWPSIIGSFFFIAQLAVGSVDIPAIWLCALFIILWSVAFVDYWGRQEARYRLKWGTTKFQQKAVARPQFHGEWTRDDVTGEWVETFAFFSRALRSGSALSSIITFLLGCVASVIAVLIVKDSYTSSDAYIAIILGVINGIMIFIFDKIYSFLSKWFNDWENHRTEEDYQNALILKSFFFKFFNSFASLFYLGFVRPFNNKQIYADTYNEGVALSQTEISKYVLAEVRTQLATLFVTAIVIQNSLEVGLPYLFGKIKERNSKKAALARGEEAIDTRSQVEKELEKEPYANTIDDMAELIVQYGYVTLFVICLPITPLLATCNNILEMKVDAFGLVNSRQRPHPNGSFGLGAWNSVLGFFSIIAVATNVALVTFQTSLVSGLIPGDESDDKLLKGQLLFFVAVSVFLALVVAFEKYVIPDVPEEVERAVERQNLIEAVLVLGARVTEDAKEPPNKDDDFFNFNPKAPYVDAGDLPEVPKSDVTVSP